MSSIHLAILLIIYLLILYVAVRIAVDWWEDYRFWRRLRKDIKARENERKYP